MDKLKEAKCSGLQLKISKYKRFSKSEKRIPKIKTYQLNKKICRKYIVSDVNLPGKVLFVIKKFQVSMQSVKSHKRSVMKKVEQVQVREDGFFRLAVVSDTHSAPHVRAAELIAGFDPDAILHAGDIGDLSVLDKFVAICPVYAVRGNIDERYLDLPDILVLEMIAKETVILRILMVHVGVYGPALRKEVAQRALADDASVVVCGHSHVPFIGSRSRLIIFNPGSIGPRRNGLPVVFGLLEATARGFHLRHIDCETGLSWKPPVR